MRWVGEGSNIFALMVYCAVGTLALANYADHRRDEQEQNAKRYQPSASDRAVSNDIFVT